MQSIVIFDNTGCIYYAARGDSKEPDGLKYMVTDIPDGKILKSVDTSGNVPTLVIEDDPESNYSLELSELKAQVAYLALMTDVEI